MWPAWWLVLEPYKKFLCASHSSSIAERDSKACRVLVKSDWYQRRWGDIVQIRRDQDNVTKFATVASGFRAITSVGSKLTGQGGDVRIFDDLNDAQEAESAAVRQRTNSWLDNASTRVNNFLTSVDVHVQQRTNAQDATGYILEGANAKDYVKLVLPMEFETKRRCSTVVLPSTNGKVWQDPRTKEGELLCPARITAAELQKLKNHLRSPYRISGQLQQNPSPADGGIIKGSWFARWTKEQYPKFIQIIQSWDCALEAGDMNSYSACSTWGVFNDENGNYNVLLVGQWRGKLEYPDLRTMAQRLFSDYRNDGTSQIIPDGAHRPSYVMVERKASGHSLIHDLQKAGITVVGFDPKPYGDKIMRVNLATPVMEAGRVWLPMMAPHFTTFRPYAKVLHDLCVLFPNSDSRDVVDAMVQVLLRLSNNGTLRNPQDDQTGYGATRVKSNLYGVDRED